MTRRTRRLGPSPALLTHCERGGPIHCRKQVICGCVAQLAEASVHAIRVDSYAIPIRSTTGFVKA